MDAKTIINNPQNAILERWGSIAQCTNSTEILNLANEVKQTLAKIKTIKIKKQLCSKEFKTAKGNSDTVNRLKKQMQGISSQLKQLDESKKQQEKTLTAHFDVATESTQPKKPSQFTTIDNLSSGLSNITISLVGDETSAKWDSYVAQHPNASLYHRYDWRGVISRSFNHEGYYFVARIENSIVGILPTTRLKSQLFGDFAVSVPYFNYGGVLANNTDIAQQQDQYATGKVGQAAL